MPIVKLSWGEARSAAIQSESYRVRSREELEEALMFLAFAGQEDTFDIYVEAIMDPGINKDVRIMAKQEHGFPEDLPDKLRALFQE